MTPELAYFLKINVAIALFYAFYRLFFHKDTFFHWRRMALLCFFAISMLYPLLNIQGWIKAHEPMVAMADLYATIILPEQVVTPLQEPVMNWQEFITQVAAHQNTRNAIITQIPVTVIVPADEQTNVIGAHCICYFIPVIDISIQ